jgi:hypothetical protein
LINCATHADKEATGYCANCGKALCADCAHQVRGALYCETCLSSMVTRAASPATSRSRHPWVAFGLGWIPGLGAVYNGEFIKGLVHVAIFAALVTMDSHGADQPFWGLATAFFICYMPIEAFISAKGRFPNTPAFEYGAHNAEISSTSTRAPIGPIVLIALGFLFLLDNFRVLQFDWVFEHGWPVLLIGLGTWMLWKRTTGRP